MKNIRLVYFLALAVIFSSSVFAVLKPEYGYLPRKPGSNWPAKPSPDQVVKSISGLHGLPRSRIMDETTASKTFGVKDINAYKTETKLPQTLLKPGRSKYSGLSRYASRQKRNKKMIGFCNYSYRTIDAAMRINGNDFVFVDKDEVIDGRNGQKRPVPDVFPASPAWVQAAVYDQMTSFVYLFHGHLIYSYIVKDNGPFTLIDIARNPTTASHNPECAMVYNDSVFLLKNGYYFEFMTNSRKVYRDIGKGPRYSFIGRKVDAALSSNHEIYFFLESGVYKISNDMQLEIIPIEETSLFFDKCHTKRLMSLFAEKKYICCLYDAVKRYVWCRRDAENRYYFDLSQKAKEP